MCALAKLIGHTDASFLNYEQVSSVWNIMHNPQMGESVADRSKKEKEDKKHRSFDDQQRSSDQDSLDVKSRQDDKSAGGSIKSQETIQGKDIFVEQK